MDLLPVRTVPLASDLPPALLADRLRDVIGDGPAASFAGSVAADAFAVSRLNEFRGTAMPLLRGSLVAAPGGGTDVRLRLRPPNVVVVFMAIWLGFLAAVAAMILAAHARVPGRSLLPLLAPAGLAAFSWFLMASVFAADARWAVESLLAAVPALRSAGPRRPG
jgi:hypothetical protein